MNFLIFATKLGMSQFYINTQCVPTTILDINTNIILNKFFYKKPNKYTLQIGCCLLKKKNKNISLLENAYKYVRECQVSRSQFNTSKVGDNIKINNLIACKNIKISSKSMGKGFAGVIKKFNFHGFPSTHGTHEMFRHGGSIGCSTKPGRVFKGKKMPGQMGMCKKTIPNIKILGKISKTNRILIKGSIPGCNKSIVMIQGQGVLK